MVSFVFADVFAYDHMTKGVALRFLYPAIAGSRAVATR